MGHTAGARYVAAPDEPTLPVTAHVLETRLALLLFSKIRTEFWLQDSY